MKLWAGRNYDYRFMFLAAFIIFAALHIWRLSASPNGYHKWRESDTAAVIQNYYQEDMSFHQPRVLQRGAQSGITGMELPIYNYSAAVLYKIFGSHHILPHLLTLLAALLSIWLFYRITTFFAGHATGVMACWALAFSPLFFFYSYKIMPDIWMLTLLLGAVYAYILYLSKGPLIAWLLSALLLCLSAGIKPLGLSVYLPLLYLTITSTGERPKKLAVFAVYICLTLLTVLGWLAYARHLQEAYGLSVFYLGGHGLKNFHRYLFDIVFIKKLFLQWPWELWIGWALTPAFLIGIYRYIKSPLSKFFPVWIIAAYIVFALTALKSSTHDYYTMIIVPPLAAVTGSGLYYLILSAGWRKIVAVILIAVAPIGAFIRIYDRFDDTTRFDRIREAADIYIPAESLVMVQDNTPVVRLYQLNRKGWPLRGEITFAETKKCVEQGAEYLILEKELKNYNDSLMLIFSDSAITLGGLYCYTLK